MKPYHFRLERVLRLKEQQKRVAELQEMQAQQNLHRSRAGVTTVRQQLSENSAALAVHVGRVVSPAAWLAFYDLSRKLGDALKKAETQLQQAQENVNQAMRRRVQISRETEALVVLRDEQQREYRHEVERQVQGHLDELSVRRWYADEPSSEDSRP
jgi:flagellar export protein FliJ